MDRRPPAALSKTGTRERPIHEGGTIMNHRRAFGTCAALALLAAAAGAQQPPTGQWYLLHQEAAKPSMVAEFESTTKEFIALVTQHRATMPDFSFNCLQGEDFMYTFVVPIQGFAGVDKVMANFGAYMQAAGPKAAEIFSRSGASFEYTNEWVVAHAPELSYQPDKPRVKIEDAKYLQYTLYYVMPGKEQEVDAIGKDFSALFRSKGLTDGYNVYKSMMGQEMPMVAVEQWGKDEADFHAQVAKNDALLGDAQKPLQARAMAITRRFEVQRTVARPDLSLPPMAKKAN
jgi:hypothetical protein